MRARAGFAAVMLTLSSSVVPMPALAGEVQFGPSDIPTVFFISKSDDGNRVDYGMRLNADCAADNNDTVFPYWREFEPPPVHTKPLGVFAHLGYGISDQRRRNVGKPDAVYQVRLKQFSQRPIFITTTRNANGHCQALARVQIGAVPFAQLDSIFVKLSGPLTVDYIVVKGRSLATGQLLEERVNR